MIYSSNAQRRAVHANKKFKDTTPKKLREFRNEEAMTSKDYKERGFISQSEDEARHSKFFDKRLKEKQKGGD